MGGGSNGDPHFNRWTIKHHDSFHGECDLVLLSSKDVIIHVRTTIRRDEYSFIELVAMRIGSHIFHIDPKQFFIDHELLTDDAVFPIQLEAEPNNHLGLAEIHQDVEFGSDIQSITIDKVGKKEYKFEWGTNSTIVVKAKGIFMNVKVDGGYGDFGKSVGLMGKYGSGKMLDRQGNPMDENDFIEFGMEWQVRDDDPRLFMTDRPPQWPEEKCRMPSISNNVAETERRRNLRADTEFTKLAMKACEGKYDFDMCVNDVLLSGELGLAETFD